MKQREKGFTLLELLIVTAIVGLVVSGAVGSLFQVLRNTEGTRNEMTAVSQVQNVGYWINRDAQKAQTVNATELGAGARTFIVSWDQDTSGGIDPGDGLYFAFSHDGGNTWSSDIEAFHGYPDSSFSYTIPDEYLTDLFRMRYYLDYFGGGGEYLYLDNIAIYEEIFSSDCSNFDNWDNGVNWDVFSGEFRGRGGVVGGAEGWYDNKWQYRKKITIDYNKVVADLADFPVLISITDSDLRDEAKSDGSDIVFTSSNGVTKLKREIESYSSSSGTLVAWVKTDLSSTSDTEIYMYYGNFAASETNDTDTWDSNFQAVWHLNTSSWLDSTSTGNTLTASGNPTAGPDGKVGAGVVLDGTGDYLRGDYSNFDNANAATYEFWLYYDTQVSADGFLTTDGINPHIFTSGGESMRVFIDCSQGRAYNYANYNVLPTGEWHYWAVTADSTISELWKDDAVVAQDTTPAYPLDEVTRDVRIGSDRGMSGRDVDGTFDEVRISNVVRPDAWIETTYNNQSDPSSFYGVGTEEIVTEGETVTYYFGGYNPGEAWTNPNNMVDGNTGTNALTQGDGNTQLCNSNTCPGTDLGTITKVELRVYAAAYEGEENDDIILRPVFGAGDGNDHQLDVPSDSSPGPGWSAWADITNDTNAPSLWTWTAVQNLDCDVVHKQVGSLDSMLAHKVEIRVTYTPAVSESERYLTMSTGLDLTFYQGETVTVAWDHREEGILEGDDHFYFAFSHNGGTTWSSNIEAFSGDIGDTPQPFSYTIPQQYLTAEFKIRFFVDFDSSGEGVYVDNIVVSVAKFSDDCSSFDNWNNGADWDVSVGEFGGHHDDGSESDRYLTMSTNLDLDPGLATAGFPLTFTWTSWSDFSDTGTKHEVTYSIVGGRLMRSYSVDGGAPVETLVAQYIDSTNSRCQLSGNKLTFTISAVVGADPATASETREFKVVTRPD